MNYSRQNISPGLIHHAQLGNKESLDRLVEAVKDGLSAYIYRLTLDYDLAQDLLQETLLCMVRSINQLEHAEQFWHWLLRTAHGVVQHHYRSLKRKRLAELSEAEKGRILGRLSADFDDGLTEVLRKEISDAVFKAMKCLKLKHRNVLILRCFENLPFSEVAAILDCSEIQSRVLFFRAKHALRRQLAWQGFGPGHLLVALTLFGFITASATAASATTTVSAATLKAGFTAGLIATLASKVGIVIMAGLAAVAMTISLKAILVVSAVVCLVSLFLILLAVAGAYG